jgi:hypothetical protein
MEMKFGDLGGPSSPGARKNEKVLFSPVIERRSASDVDEEEWR